MSISSSPRHRGRASLVQVLSILQTALQTKPTCPLHSWISSSLIFLVQTSKPRDTVCGAVKRRCWLSSLRSRKGHTKPSGSLFWTFPSEEKQEALELVWHSLPSPSMGKHESSCDIHGSGEQNWDFRDNEKSTERWMDWGVCVGWGETRTHERRE